MLVFLFLQYKIFLIKSKQKEGYEPSRMFIANNMIKKCSQ